MGSGRETLSTRVIEAVATTTGRDPVALPPLYDAIDPEALDELGECVATTEIAFEYAGHHIVVDGDGTITVEDRSDCDVWAGSAASSD